MGSSCISSKAVGCICVFLKIGVFFFSSNFGGEGALEIVSSRYKQ